MNVVLKMVTSAIVLVHGIAIVYAVIAAASTGSWASSVVALVTLIPLMIVAAYLLKLLA